VLRTKFIAPVPALAEGWERANGFLDGVVRSALAKGRDDGGFSDLPLHHGACRAARELLAQGDREAAKDLIRALARAREFGACSEAVVPSLQQLLIGFRAWTADDEFLDRYQPGLAGLDRTLPPRPTARLAKDGGSDRGVVAEVTDRLWGLWPDAPAGGLHLAPMLEAGWPQMALLGLRVGTTSLDLRFERRPSGYSLSASRTHGTRLRLTVWLEELDPTGLWIDEESLGGQRAVFELAGEHELRIEGR
jgi:hypothetical protein